MQVAAPKPKAIRRAHPGQGVPMWRASKWPNQRSCVENGEKGLGRDHLYSVAALTNSAGAVVERYRYSSYGERTVLAADGVTTRAASSYNQQVGFTGRYLDKETGLWYFRARYYSGTLGRFISRDPLEFVNGLSLYGSYYIPNETDYSGCSSYRYGFDDPLFTPDAGAGIYNSTPVTWEMWGKKKLAYGAIGTLGTLQMLPDARKHLGHYFKASGSDLSIRLVEMIDEVPSAMILLQKEVEEAQDFVEKNCKSANFQEITSSKLSNGANEKAESKNWFYGVGSYSSWGKGYAKCTPSGDGIEYEMKFYYNFIDKYNWDEGKGVSILGMQIMDDDMGEFHRQGLAQEFMMTGKITKTFKWKEFEVLDVSQGWKYEK